jgi:multiple antibiotic resistance protein
MGSEALRSLVALFVVVNPLGGIPAFISLTDGYDDAGRHVVARVAALMVGGVLVASALCGEALLGLFGIDVAHFQIGGGILLLTLALSMLHAQPSRARETPEEMGEASNREQIGAVPLGTPILAGPGSISTVIIQSHHATTLGAKVWLMVACVVVAALTWVALQMAQPIRRVLGQTGIHIATRLFGLVLAALAVRFMCDGLLVLMPGLGRG